VHIQALWQFPIKGIGGSSLDRTALCVDHTLPGDRRYALSAGSRKAAKAGDGVWLQKAHFLQLMQTESLAALNCRLDGDMVTIHAAGTVGFQGNLAVPEHRTRCQNFIATFLALSDPKSLRIHQIDNGAYTDQPEPLISIGGSASLAAFAAATHTPIDARRFRLNIILDTRTAFAENQWGGAQLQMGSAVIKIIDDVERCAAINVDPATATRQSDHLATMRQHFGHSHIGVFGRVMIPGIVQCGDKATLISSD